MENLYDISKEIRILDSEINRYSFLLESDESTIDNYYLTGDSLFIEADDSNKRPSILYSIINAIKRFITKCKAKFFKLIGSDKYKEYEAELSKNKELANKKVKYNPRTKEFETLEKDTKDINKIIEKIKNGTASDEEISKLEEQVDKHTGLDVTKIAVNTGLGLIGLYGLFKIVKKRIDEKNKITDSNFQFINQPDLLDPNKNIFSDKQISQFQKSINIAKKNVEERNKLLFKVQQEAEEILDSELKELLHTHEETSRKAKNLADKQIGIGKKFKENKKHTVDKFSDREGRSNFARIGYEEYHKDKSYEEKQLMSKRLRNEIKENKDYIHSKSLSENLKDKADERSKLKSQKKANRR